MASKNDSKTTKYIAWHIATQTNYEAAGFPPPQEHNLVAMAILLFNPEDTDSKVKLWAKTDKSTTPAAMLATWNKAMDGVGLSLSCNGHSFGCPVLIHNALNHGVPIPKLFLKQDYRQSLDVAEWIGNYVTIQTKYVGFNEVTKELSLPDRVKIDVNKAYKNDKHAAITKYLSLDCLIIALSALRIQTINGRLNKEQYVSTQNSLLQFYKDKSQWFDDAFISKLLG